ncbi:hypothetical protein A33I_09160 [Alkalihalophilus marmarensis DSM 21297]|uniref:Uncharacterized protein n=1 Tax=Alkalihalophilus marmarensis DSM 21297 TaxID=1188261 RepID=U6SRI0_9BACI|nr:hypothetical protein A33I_09160 [Alkalihalophilus marmarensis DSM 21297]
MKGTIEMHRVMFTGEGTFLLMLGRNDVNN